MNPHRSRVTPSLVTLTVGTVLALGTQAAQAHITRIDPAHTNTAASSSAAQLKAQERRWEAIAKFYLKEYKAQSSRTQSSQDLRPDDRAGALGAGSSSDPATSDPSGAIRGRGPLA